MIVMLLLYRSIIYNITAANPLLGGVLLQWTTLLQPYYRNFIEYRPIANLTAAYAQKDNLPFMRFPFSFSSFNTRRAELRNNSLLVPGVVYEFRMAYTAPSYVYYTNSQYGRIYGINSTKVRGLKSSSSDSSVFLSWNAPEFVSGLLGYQVRLYIGSTIQTFNMTRTSLMFSYYCNSGVCLQPETAYNLSVACIRDRGIDSPLMLTVTTQAIPAGIENQPGSPSVTKAEFRLFTEQIVLTFVYPTISYGHDTVVAATFLFPLRLSTLRQGVNLTLSTSTVVSISATSLVIKLKTPESTQLLDQLRSISVFSPLMLYYGDGQAIKVTYICL